MRLPALHWPDGLDRQRFLDEYWQQKPLLIRQAFPRFASPVTPDDLAGMSLEDETTPRLILGDGRGRYTVEHGPFDEQRFDDLAGSDWSLLVTDVEKHFPELGVYLAAFDFLPDWRIDDLMISYAPDGGSVGAHVDDYDVFLLQASGVRRWHIDTRASADLTPRDDCAVNILAHFDPDQHYDLKPGDVLYLPPRLPHHGVAVGDDCTTWSIGLRAPSASELLSDIAEQMHSGERVLDDRFRDPPLRADARRGELTPEALEALHALWRRAIAHIDADFAAVAGTLLTRKNPHAPEWSEAESAEPIAYDTDAADAVQFQVNPFSRLLYLSAGPEAEHDDAGLSGTVRLFADGIEYRCSRGLADALCRRGEASVCITPGTLTASDRALLETLYNETVLLPLSAPGE